LQEERNAVSIGPEIGITSTPAIALDRPRAAGAWYVVAKTLRGKTTTSSALGSRPAVAPLGQPTPIAGEVPGAGKGATGRGVTGESGSTPEST
jgi:hypothetical protein